MTESNGNKEKLIRVGSRKSELALIQTKYVISRLQKLYPHHIFEIHTMSTMGDRVLNVSLPKIGEKSLFTRDLEDSLRNGGVDFVVHSLKDLPTALPTGMAIGAILEREDSRDALVLNEKFKGKTIKTLPTGSVIGTSSLRRTAQVRRLYPHLEVCDIRGNLNTRLAKLDAPHSKFAGIILAQAGLLRMGWENRISQVLNPVDLLYAVGQGALAVECRSNDEETLEMLQCLMCLPTTCRILCERSFLKTLGGGCSAPVAVCTNLQGVLEKSHKKLLTNGASIQFTGAVWSLDGQTEIRDEIGCCLDTEKKRKYIENTNSSSSSSSFSSNNENDDGNSPNKRLKIDEHFSETSSEDSSPTTPVKRNSPIIVNEDKFPELKSSDVDNSAGDSISQSLMKSSILSLDLKKLIDVHGELFKKCPFYALHQKENENGSTSDSKQAECPLNLPVGQDFMGKCPYVDTQQKVELAEQGACPMTKLATKTTIESLKPTSNGDTPLDEFGQGESILKCPFSNLDLKLKDTSTEKRISFEGTQPAGHDICPFLQKSIKMIDYEDNEKPKIMDIPPIMLDNCKELFCGIYRHQCYARDLFAKCDELGRELADNLIRKGALEVMKRAQEEIHNKI